LLASGAGGTGSPSHPTAERIEPMASRRRDVRQVGEQVVGMSKFRYYNRRGAMFLINISVVKDARRHGRQLRAPDRPVPAFTGRNCPPPGEARLVSRGSSRKRDSLPHILEVNSSA
jgi:hypothetical protein